MVEVTARQVHRTAIDNRLAEAGNRIAGNDQGQSAAGNRRREQKKQLPAWDCFMTGIIPEKA